MTKPEKILALICVGLLVVATIALIAVVSSVQDGVLMNQAWS